MFFPEPVISMSIEPKTSDDSRRLSEALGVIRREDPSFRSNFDEETGQTIISGMGELHLEIIKNKLVRDMKINVNVGKPKVSYRETITRKVEDVRGLFKKQTGGRGQFGDVIIHMEPYTAAQAEADDVDFDDNVAVVSDITGGSIPKEFIKPAMDGCRLTVTTGVKFALPHDQRQGHGRGRLVPRGGLLAGGVRAGRAAGRPRGHREVRPGPPWS